LAESVEQPSTNRQKRPPKTAGLASLTDLTTDPLYMSSGLHHPSTPQKSDSPDDYHCRKSPLMPLLLLLLSTLHTADTIPRPDTLKFKLLKTATVTGKKPVIEHQLDRIVLNVDQQLTAAGTNALELLRQLPGVEVGTDGQITLNGRAGITVLIDGKPTYLSAEDLAAQLAGTPSATIQKVEIMTNPSAKYDAAGTGGLINIVRKRNRADGLNGSFTATAGESHYPRYGGSLLLSYKTAGYNLYLNNNYGYSKNLFGREVTANIFNGNNLLTQQVSSSNDVTTNKSDNTVAGIDLFLSKQTTLTLSGNVSARRYTDLTTSAMNIFKGDLAKSGSETCTALNADRPFNYTMGFQLSHKIDTVGQEWSVDADYSKFRYRPGQYNTTNSNDSAGNFEDQSNVYLGQSRTLQIIGVRADYTLPWPGEGKLEAGLKSSYVRTVNNSSYYNQSVGQDIIDSAQSDYNINTENISAAYFNMNREFKRLTIQAGLRAEQTIMKGEQLYVTQPPIGQSYFQLFPSLFAGYKPDAHNSFNIQLGRRIDRADYHELVPFRRPLTPTLYFQGNPYLRPDLTWHGEITWAWKNAVFFTAAYDIDKDYVRTLPYLDKGDSTTTRVPTNIQGAHSWNVEISYNHQITTWWTTNTTAMVYNNSFTGAADSGFRLTSAGIVTLDLVSNNSFIIGKDLSAEIDFERESRRQLVQSAYGAYSIVSFAVKKQLPGKKASLTLSAHNILQSEGHSSTDNYLNLYQYSYARYYTRTVILSFSYRFGGSKATQTKRLSGSTDEQQRAGN
jgi:hypothetical protein